MFMVFSIAAVLPAVPAATELFRTSAPANLRMAVSSSEGSLHNDSMGDPVPIVVYDGESVEQVVRRTVADQGLPESSLAPLRSLVTERTMQGIGDTALRQPLCQVPVALTVPSQLSESGQDMQQGVMLTIFEDTDAAALAKQLTARYLLPAPETLKLRDVIETMMLKHIRARVTVSIGGGEQRTLVVRKGETAAAAAGRFAAKFGLTQAAKQRLMSHILEQLPGPDLVLTGDEWRA
jgi:hypothetical protein